MKVKKEIRRAIMKACGNSRLSSTICFKRNAYCTRLGNRGITNHPFALLGKTDVLKVIDQGADESVNAVNIKKLVQETTGVEPTEQTAEARHYSIKAPYTRSTLTKDKLSILASSNARTTS